MTCFIYFFFYHFKFIDKILVGFRQTGCAIISSRRSAGTYYLFGNRVSRNGIRHGVNHLNDTQRKLPITFFEFFSCHNASMIK